MTANLSASADPKIKEIITSLDDDKIGKVTYLHVMHLNKVNACIFFTDLVIYYFPFGQKLDFHSKYSINRLVL